MGSAWSRTPCDEHASDRQPDRAPLAGRRARVARLLCDTAAYLQDGGWVFVDPVSGKGTSWGYWDPAQLNGVPGKPDEVTAHHIT